jgi:2-polyprenyl-3-methyl-5-hydroxy-6-metoxy-1,4-benzoquinol methylase
VIQKNNKKQNSDQQEFYDCLFKNEDHYGVEKFKHGWAGNFHRYRIKLLRDLFVNKLKCQKKTKILDIGSNISMFGQIFKSEECPEITAFDISKTVIEKGKKMYPHIKFLIDGAQDPKIEGQWDILFAGEIIEHLLRPEEALLKWKDLLKEGGYLVLSTPNRFFNRLSQEHPSLLSMGQVKRIFRDLNFEILQIIGIDIFNPPLDWFLNKVSKKFSKLSKVIDGIFQIKMRLTFKLPWLAHDVIYVARKR